MLALMLTLAAPQAAGATTTVSLGETYIEGYKGSGGYEAGMFVSGDDGPNAITVTNEGVAVLVQDPGGVVASTGCAPVLSAPFTEVRCPKRGSLSGKVRAGGGDDVVTAPLELDGGDGDDVLKGRDMLRGGAGDDVLGGGDSIDLLDGGPGADVLDGSEGDDLALFVDRDENLHADLGSGVVRVGSAEIDHLVGVEGLLAGPGDDRLTGSAGDDRLLGGPGDDTLSGGAGADQLTDAIGRNRLDGGAGPDSLSTQPPVSTPELPLDVRQIPVGSGPAGPARILGGRGADELSSGRGSDRMDGGSGRDAVHAGGGRDGVWLRDGHSDAVYCGRGAAVRVDRHDLTSRCRRLKRTGVARPVLTSVGGVIFEENDGREGFADLACSDDQRRGCRGLLRVIALGRTVGKRRFRMRPGRRAFLNNIPLDRRVSRVAARRGRLAVLYRVETRDARGRRVVLRKRDVFCPDKDPGDCR